MNHFPTYLALGAAFCNRKEELARLTANIKGTNPSLIMSPRRYGKTSLALNAFEHLNYPYVHIDFYKELSEADIEKAVLNGIGKLMGKLEKGTKKLMQLASDFFASMQIRVSFEKDGFALDFSRRKNKAADNILEALKKLHELAKKRKKIVILFMDEFQTLAEVAKDHSIEAAIRHAAQESVWVAYVFSGSNRHLISRMFYDKKRPFYQLCDLISLNRISSKDYENYIQKTAVHKWGKKLSTKTLNHIFLVTENHPYYINKLCSLLWLNDFPHESSVIKCWNTYALESKSLIEKETALLSLNQRKLLIFLSRTPPTKEPYHKDFIEPLHMSVGSLSQALNALKEKDYIYIDTEGYYRVLDPLIKTIFCF